MLSFINENIGSDILNGIGGAIKRVTLEPIIAPIVLGNSIKNEGLKNGIIDFSKDIFYHLPKGAILQPKNMYDMTKDIYIKNGFSPAHLSGFAATEVGLGLARPAVPLAAGAYGIHKALEDDVPIEQVKTSISDTVDDVKDNTLNFVDEHPILAGTAGLGGTALAGGALYNYLKNRNKK